MENITTFPIPPQESVEGVPLPPPSGASVMDIVTPPSADALLIEQSRQVQPPDPAAPIQNVHGMAHALEQASQGKITYEEATRNLYLDGGYSSKVLRDYAATSYIKDIADAKDDFAIAAAKGNIVKAETRALYIDQLNTAVQQISNNQAILKTTQDAATNLVVSNPAAIENNDPGKLYRVSKSLGTDAGILEILEQYKAKNGLETSMAAQIGTVVGSVGVPLVGAFVLSAPLSIALSTGVGLKFSHDAFNIVPNAIFEVTGIKKTAFSYADQIAELKVRLGKMPESQAVSTLVAIADKIKEKQPIGGAPGKVFTAWNLQKLSDAISENKWEGVLPSLSLNTQENLDRLGLGLDTGSVFKGIRNAFSASKLGAKLNGTPSTGSAIGADLVNQTNRTVGNENPTGYALSMEFSQYMPDSVNGLSAPVQKVIAESLEKTLEVLNERIRINNDPKDIAALNYIRNTARSTSPNISSVNLNTGELIIQHHSGTPFQTRAAAQAAADDLAKATGNKVEVVPANEHSTTKLTPTTYQSAGSFTKIDENTILKWIADNSFGNVFHGTANVFTKFDISMSQTGGLGQGVYTTPLRSSGENYARMRAVEQARDTDSFAFGGTKGTYADHYNRIDNIAEEMADFQGVSPQQWIVNQRDALDRVFDKTIRPVAEERGVLREGTAQLPSETVFLQRTLSQQHPEMTTKLNSLIKKEGLTVSKNATGDEVFTALANKYGYDKNAVLRKYGIEGAFNNATNGSSVEIITFDGDKVKLLRDVSRGDVSILEQVNQALKKAQEELPTGHVQPSSFVNGKADEMLSIIAKTSKDAGYVQMAKALLALSEKMGLNKINWARAADLAEQGNYTTKLDQVVISESRVGNETLTLHEISHAATATVLEAVRLGMGKSLGLSAKQIEAAQNILDMHKDNKIIEALVNATKNTPEGSIVDDMILNVHEFLSYGLTERGKIFDVLKSTKVDGGSLLTKLGMLISRILGISTDSAFTKLNDNFSVLISDLTYQQRVAASEGMLTGQVLASRSSITNGWYAKLPGSSMVHTADDIASRWGLGADPVHQASRLAVSDRVVSLQQSSKDRNALLKFLDDGLKGLSSRDNAKVVQALRDGDTLGKEFNVVELEAAGIKSDAAKRAYYTYRIVSNLDLAIKNQTIKENLIRRGYSQGFVTVGAATHPVPARTLPFTEYVGMQAYNLNTGRVETINATKHTGARIIESASPVSITGKGEYTRFIDDGSKVSFGQHLYNPIPNRQGSFRHYYTQDYFGSVKLNRVVNGEMKEDVLHLRTSNSGKDIGKWKEGMDAVLNAHRTNPASVTAAFVESKLGRFEDTNAILAAIRKGEWDNYIGFEHHYDRTNNAYIDTLAKAQWDDDLAKMDGRGMRLQSIDTNKDNLLDPYRAIQAEISNVSMHRNIDEWRDKWVQTWWESFSDKIPKALRESGRSPLSILSDTSLQHSVYLGGDDVGKFAESQRKYILSQLGVKSTGEQLIEAAMVNMTNRFSEDSKIAGMRIGGPLITAGHALRNADPVAFIRSFNFHTMLAAFNPAQLIVQGAGAVNAIAVSPLHGLKAAYTAPLMRVALMSDNPAVWRMMAGVEKVATLGMNDAQEFVDTVKAIRRSGILSNIHSTAMYSAEEGRFNLFSKTMKAVGQAAAIPFNRGEEFARLVSFDVARREWMAKNPGASFLTDDALRNIVTRQDDLTQNMTRANEAEYQKGIFSIPSQFLQYNIKLAANLLGSVQSWASGKPYRGYTMAESSRILAMHIAAFGLAGNGVISIADEVVGGYEKIVGRKATDDEKLTFSQGALAGLVNEVSQLTTGQDLKLGLGSRLGAFEYYEKLAKTLWAGDASFWEVMLGPTYGSATRLGSMQALVDPFLRKDLSVDAFSEALYAVGKETISTWRSIDKAYYAQLHHGQIPNKEGKPIVTITKPEIIAQWFGIGSASEQDYWRLKLTIADRRSSVKKFAEEYIKVYDTSIQELSRNGNSARYQTLVNFMSTLHSPLPYGESKEFWDIVSKARGQAAVSPFVDEQTKIRADYLNGTWVMKDVITTRKGGVIDTPIKETK